MSVALVVSGKPEPKPGFPLEPLRFKVTMPDGTGGWRFISCPSGSGSERKIMKTVSIRQAMRARRKALSLDQLQRHSDAIVSRLLRSQLLPNQGKLAGYWAAQGEPDLSTLIAPCQASGCELYLPKVIDAKQGSMRFYPFTAVQALQQGAFNLMEPLADGPGLTLRDMDAVLLPLLAFDSHGHRVGMGGGFYDRALAFTREPQYDRAAEVQHPLLIGVAHDFQQLEQIEPSTWDVPLDWVFTEARQWDCKAERAASSQ